MSGNLKAIKEQIGAVGSLKKITRAMEMVARSKMKKAVDSALAARPYAEKVLSLLQELSDEGRKSNHPLLREHGEAEKILVVHIASEKGLCGSYNAQALRGFSHFVHKFESGTVDAVSVGKYAAKHIDKLGVFHIQDFSVDGKSGVAEARKLSEFLSDRFLEGKYSKVFVSYINFKTVFSQEYIVQQILPLSRESIRSMVRTAGAEEEVEDAAHLEPKEDLFAGFFERYRYEPSKQFILESLLPGLLATQVYQALLESQASEQSSRMVAMKSATDNAVKFEDRLVLRYNRARQASITREIIEIAAGADAV